MSKALKTPNYKGQNEISLRLSQKQTIFNYLQENTATASMITEATGIPQKCITRYKRDLEKIGRLWEVERKRCQKTGFLAWYLTTDIDKAPKSQIQLNLF
jgi:hypothetical protein